MRSDPLPFTLGFLTCGLALGLSLAHPAVAQNGRAAADVVVIVDTSTSMRQPGMDPERASLLVTKLLADIVPGELAAVRLLDLEADQDVLPRRVTGDTIPCDEDPTQRCQVVDPASDWDADARRKKLGALRRPAPGDGAFKRGLESHLEQRSNNSPFHLAFRAAQGIFEEHRQRGGPEVPQTAIWLSDGRTSHPDLLPPVIAELQEAGVVIEAIVFGQGETELARQIGLEPRRVSTPAEMMKAFAGTFRRIVQAPYEIDNTVAGNPSFEMKPHVDEAWVVVYGDDSLGAVALAGPEGELQADAAAERWPGAGAYRVAYLRRPQPGRWTVRTTGGGPGTAYAVVQFSALTPALLEPRRATADIEVALVAGVRAGGEGEILDDPELLRGATLTAAIDGEPAVPLADDGSGGDPQAGDGRYTARVRFHRSGRVPVVIRLRNALVDRPITAEVEVEGGFRYPGGPIELDLGALGVDAESCRTLDLGAAEHRGAVAFELDRLRRPPKGHRLEVRLPAGTLTPGSDPVSAAAGDRFEVCLATSPKVASSRADGEPWLRLRVRGSDEAQHQVPIHLRWEVEGLSFWGRWGRLILILLAILVAAFVVAGFIVPDRFPGSLALTFVPERDELDEQTPQPIKQWKGVGIGFYRNARAFLHPDFRLSGRPQGALAELTAERRGARVSPKGMALYRETLDGDWESVPPAGRRARAGDVYRVGERGPYFRIAVRRRGR